MVGYRQSPSYRHPDLQTAASVLLPRHRLSGLVRSCQLNGPILTPGHTSRTEQGPTIGTLLFKRQEQKPPEEDAAVVAEATTATPQPRAGLRSCETQLELFSGWVPASQPRSVET